MVGAAAAAAAPSQPWPQAQSNVPTDPAVRFGVLPNGVRYAIMHNETPKGRASLQVRIDAGSLMEADDQRGLAHFMEHMAFNGTTHLPKNKILHQLERMGLAFGADVNAFTGFDETVYMLEVPQTDDKNISTALNMLREQVSEVTLAEQDVQEERGVVAGEERARNSPSFRVALAQMQIFAKGQKIADRFPIGDMKIVNGTPQKRIADFYHAYYRPSRATVIAIGDFDPDAMEAKIRANFADWTSKTAEGPEPDLGVVAAHGPETHILVEPGVSTSAELAWVAAPDLRPDTLAVRREKLLHQMALDILTTRLADLADQDNPPFRVAQANRVSEARSFGATLLGVSFAPGQWKRALEAIDQEQRRFVQYGVTDAELEREIVAGRTVFDQAASGALTRSSQQLAQLLAATENARVVFTSPEQDRAEFNEVVKGLTVAELNANIKPIFEGGGPITIMTTPTPIEGGEGAVAVALDASRKVAVAAPAAQASLTWPYTNLGPAGAVVSRKQLDVFGATEVTFANGVVLTVKHTDFEKNSILISVEAGSGEMNFSPEHIDGRRFALGVLTAGGLGKLTDSEISRTLNGHVVGKGFDLRDDKFALFGGTRPADLELQMQVLAAYLTDPAFRTAAYDKALATRQETVKNMRTTPDGAFDLQTREILGGGDKRTAYASSEEAARWSIDDMRPSLKALLSKGPISITMVGDVSVDQAIAATATTFAALPPRPPVDAPPPGADQRHFAAPAATPLQFTHDGLARQAFGYVAWPTTDEIGPQRETIGLWLLVDVIRLRALDEIRERLAIAYSPHVGGGGSGTYRGYGYILASAQTTPKNLPVFFKAVDDIVQKLRNEPVSEDELKRARAPMIENIRHGLQLNGFWSGVIVDAHNNPNHAVDPQTFISDLQAITPADIQAMARKYLRPDTAWKAEVTPSKKALASDGPKPESDNSLAPTSDTIKP